MKGDDECCDVTGARLSAADGHVVVKSGMLKDT